MSDSVSRLSLALSDRYTIEREIGAGGMATVYLAHDNRHDRDVAIKVLRRELTAILGRERFLNEIRLTARLDHPHILTLIDSGETDGFFWYVTPFVRGESLRARLDREKQLGVDEALAIAKQIAGALGYAHAKGIIHRDIKPENILLHEGEAVLADFGIALAMKEAGGNRLTETGLSLGTPQYMSPEQATGDRDLDARSDIYSLGAVLYEMLTGEPPFGGATVQAVIAKLMTERPTRIRTVRDTVPESIETAVLKALAKVPADRFSGAEEFVQALESGVAPVKIRRHRALFPLLAVTGLLLAVAIGALIVRGVHRSPAMSPAERRQLTFSGKATYPILSPDGRYVAYLERRDCGDSTRASACPDDLVIQETAENGARRVLASSAGTQPLGWSPDSRELMVTRSEGSAIAISIMSAMNGATRFLSSTLASWGTSSDTVFTWSLPGKDGHPWIMTRRAGDGTPVDSLAATFAYRLFSVRVSPDGRWWLVEYQTEPTGLLRLAVLDRRGTLLEIIPHPTDVIGWGSGSDRVYVVSFDGSAATQLLRWNLDSRTGKTEGEPQVVLKLAQSPRGISIAGNSLAFGEAAPPVTEIWALRRSSPTSRWQPARRVYETTATATAVISRDGERVLIMTTLPGGDAPARQVSSMPFDGGPLTAWGSSRYGAALSADRSMDADQAVIAEPRNGHTWVSLYDPRTNAARELGQAPTDSGTIFWLADGRFLWHPDLRPEIFLLSRQWQVERHWSWGDSLVIGDVIPAPDGRAVAIRFGRVAGDSSISALARVSLEDGKMVPFWTDTIRNGNYWTGEWTRDGSIHLYYLESFPIHPLRIPVGGGAAVADVPLPVTGDYLSRMAYSDDALRAIVTVERRSYDVVLERNFDPGGKQ